MLTPLINAAVYYLIFGVMLDTSSDVANFIAYLCTGVFVFTFTQTVGPDRHPGDQRQPRPDPGAALPPGQPAARGHC